MVHSFDSISITQFPPMICSVSVEGSINCVAHAIYIFLLLALSKSFLLNLCAFAACLPLSSARHFSHTCAGLACSMLACILLDMIVCITRHLYI